MWLYWVPLVEMPMTAIRKPTAAGSLNAFGKSLKSAIVGWLRKQSAAMRNAHHQSEKATFTVTANAPPRLPTELELAPLKFRFPLSTLTFLFS